jgi:DNA-3-methyladenine glycosylase I
MTTYCDFVRTRPEGDVHRHYHDHNYGFSLHDDNALFERLVLEIASPTTPRPTANAC